MVDESRLPPLEGTPKQIGWATYIRREKLSGKFSDFWLHSETDAKYWIENRRKEKAERRSTHKSNNLDPEISDIIQSLVSKTPVITPDNQNFDLEWKD